MSYVEREPLWLFRVRAEDFRPARAVRLEDRLKREGVRAP